MYKHTYHTLTSNWKKQGEKSLLWKYTGAGWMIAIGPTEIWCKSRCMSEIESEGRGGLLNCHDAFLCFSLKFSVALVSLSLIVPDRHNVYVYMSPTTCLMHNDNVILQMFHL